MIEGADLSQRESLFEKIQGPNAVPIDTLVQRGDAAAQRARADFPVYLNARVPVVEAVAKALFAADSQPEKWQSYYTMVRDLRSSSAAAAYHTVSSVCRSLETLLIDGDSNDPRMRAVIELHLDALKLAIADKIPDETASTSLLDNLERAVKRLASL